MENPPIFKNGKPSISIRAIYTMAMLVITRGYLKKNITSKPWAWRMRKVIQFG